MGRKVRKYHILLGNVERRGQERLHKDVLRELDQERFFGVDQRDAKLRKGDEKIPDKSPRHGRPWSSVVFLLNPQGLEQHWHLICAQ